MTLPGQLPVTTRGDDVQFAVKVVPGAARDRIAGLLGDALKVQISAPPERGRANERLCEVLAAVLGVPARSVQVTSGASNARKVVAVSGLTAELVQQRLAAHLAAKGT
ncbi:MAG: DUF167 domain-containing protein [Planctomycetota bacterium]